MPSVRRALLSAWGIAPVLALSVGCSTTKPPGGPPASPAASTEAMGTEEPAKSLRKRASLARKDASASLRSVMSSFTAR